MKQTEQNANYLRLALSIQGIIVDNLIAEQLIETFNLLSKKKGSFNVHDAAVISAKYQERRKPKNQENEKSN